MSATTLKKEREGLYQTAPHTLLVSSIKVDGQPIGSFSEGEMWFHKPTRGGAHAATPVEMNGGMED